MIVADAKAIMVEGDIKLFNPDSWLLYPKGQKS